MANRSPARWLAPSALVAAAIALVVVLSTSLTSDSSTEAPAPTLTAAVKPHRRAAAPAPRPSQPATTTGPTGLTGPTSGQGTYTVQPGDILSTVSAKTGVPVDRLRELNPGLDANNMSVGQTIRLEP